MKCKVAIALLLALAGIALAHADTRETQQRNLERFERYAGAPVGEFDFWSLYKFQVVGPENVVVWSTIKDAYLLSVDSPCPRLEFANAIGVTSQQRHVVSSKFDYVTFGHDRCKIREIRPIDYQQMLKDGPDAAKQDAAKD
ncbi:MAG TPA: DUF6491 family protein [Rhodanobacteraceae bacterium]|nr:DUF6491 family protein [Rhodanobacteraceae bacterium]